MPGVEAVIMKAQLRWVGHVVRIDDSRLPKMISSLSWPLVRVTLDAHLKRFKEKHPLVCATFPLLDGKLSPQTVAPGEWPS